MYLPEAIPIPWRALQALERLRLRAAPWQHAAPATPTPSSGVLFRLLALGDVALTSALQVEPEHVFGGIAPLLASVDVRTANLEAQLTERTERAGVIGSGVRAAPEMVHALARGGLDVLNVANNHALDYGNAAFAESVQRLREAGMQGCGFLHAPGSDQAPAIVRANGHCVAFLGYTDDHFNGPDILAAPRPALALVTRIEADVRSARSAADFVVVHVHWGYEFALHPLLEHRDLARRVIDAGASLVLCHHAHVPLGYERRANGAIAYGLGNACMPLSPYLRSGHPWTNRSVALEFSFDRAGVCGVRAHPIHLLPDGRPVPLAHPAEARALCIGLDQMCRRLVDDAWLLRLQVARRVVEALRLPEAIMAAAATSRRALRERIGGLTLPRQMRLIEFLHGIEELKEVANQLAMPAGGDPAKWDLFPLDDVLRGFALGREQLTGRYRWFDAIRARTP
jgi:poly-gamma-glutamate capsule biosynthesis protein CapA/YwtB (metallophosphatase superfamily)